MNAEPHKIGVAHVVLRRDLVFVGGIEHDFPTRFVERFFVDLFGIIYKPRDAPHIARRIFFERFARDCGRFFEYFGDIIRNVCVIDIELRCIEGLDHALRRKFHDHVFGGAYEVVFVAQFELIV